MKNEDILNKMSDIENRINDLQSILDSFRSSNSIPRDIETSLRERLAVMSAVGTTGSASTQSVSVPSTPTNITVPAQPAGTVAVSIGNTTYNLLYQ